ncbi:UbiD family decarboxylase [Alicyclobacillaceae bacterium I2511]|nr:UbiD family decarboxylase [Alicyclobacillaceae bacterium I2511]
MDDTGGSFSEAVLVQARDYLQELISLPILPFERSLKAIAVITWVLEKVNLHPIVVGGKAVEIYTTGSYTTMDVDLVVSGRHLVQEALSQLGFQQEPDRRHWYHSGLHLPIEIPDSILEGSQQRVMDVDVDGYTLHVIGVEDLILDRLRAAVHWKSLTDQEWAEFLLAAHWESIDLNYLENEASRPENDVRDLLDKLLHTIDSD